MLLHSLALGMRFLPAVLPGFGYIARKRPVSDHAAHFTVSVRWQECPCLHKQSQAVIKRVPLLGPVLREEAVPQAVISHHILYLQHTQSTSAFTFAVPKTCLFCAITIRA